MPEGFNEGVSLEYREEEKKTETKIVLDFMRHSKKEQVEGKPNKEIRLTEEGRILANKKGENLGKKGNEVDERDPERAVIWSSGNERADETGYHAMIPGIDENATLEQIEEEIDQNMLGLKKLGVDKRLDYYPETDAESKAFGDGEYIKYLVERSDKLTIEAGDKNSSSYARLSGNIAEIVRRYLKIGNTFNKMASENSEYEKIGKLERYLVSHQGITEAFIVKVLEKTGGVEKRDEFVSRIGNGFKETQGFRVEIINNGEDQKMRLTYELPGEDEEEEPKEETIEIDKELIEEIIEERDEFEEEVAASAEKTKKA